MSKTKIFITGIFLLLILSILRLTLGEWEIPICRVFYYLLPNLSEIELSNPEAIIIREIRLPRILSTILTGGLLSVAGIVLQGILANPMAEPYTLGIASGAAFGASLGILFNDIFILPSALIGSCAALILVKIISLNGGRERIILAGIIVNAFLSAGVTFMKAISGEKLYAVILWLMGNFSGVNFSDVLRILAGVLLVLIPAIIFAPYLDVMSLGSERGLILGINENLIRNILLFTTSFGVALSVSSTGITGFIGLIVPHLLRILNGASHRNLIIQGFIFGGILMLISDGAAQFLGEIPAGVITALLGAPYLCLLLIRR